MSIKINDKIKFNQKTYSVPELAEKIGLDLTDMTIVIATLNILERQGKISVIDNTTPEETMVENALKQSLFQDTIVGNLKAEEENEQILRRQKKLDEVDHVSIALTFYQTLQAQKFNNWVNMNGINTTKLSQNLDTGEIELIINDITPAEYTVISNKYTAENAINKTVNMADKTVKKTTDGVNYMASEVVAPVAKIAGKGAMNLAKGLFHTGIKVGASLINSGVQAVEETKVALATDPELLKASDQLLNAKNAIARGVVKQKNKMGGSGIKIL